MSLFSILVVAVVLGLIYSYLPLKEPFKQIILVVFILILIFLLLQFAGIGGGPILRIR